MAVDETPISEQSSDDLLNIDEAAKFLDTSKSTLYRLLSGSEVKGTKVGKQWRFRKADLVAYLQRTPETVTVTESARGDLEAEAAFLMGQLQGSPRTTAQTNVETADRAIDGIRNTECVSTVTANEPLFSAERGHRQVAELIVKLAVEARASDIHVEPTPNSLRLRFRIDGVLHEIRRMPKNLAEPIVGSFKELADMTLSERRLPQDGRFPFHHGGHEYDIRANVLPTIDGENIVMRILDRSSVLLGLENLGLAPATAKQVRDAVRRPNGLVIATGPTGSGKTTLLYSCLQEIAGEGVKTVSVEDPVEYQLANVGQVQTNKRAGLTFAAAMRSFLRQDADVIYCSEMRDADTANVAVEATLTGHMVLSALHTEDAPSVITRLIDIGVEPFIVAATLSAAMSVRLARRLCPDCKTVADPDEIRPVLEKVRPLAQRGGYIIPDSPLFFEAVGCDSCRNTGYQGRTGLYEVLTCTPRLVQELVRSGSPEEAIRIAVANGMRTLLADGVAKAVAGETTLDEALRVTGTLL
jgi:type IV pilus assembly protein PilB